MVQAPLPVDAHLDAIISLVRAERRAIIVAPPGAGKTTRIPPALLPLGRTILLQPRRVAARTLTRRIADERGWTIGEEIGWQIRFERRFNARTRLLVATEGILTARLQADPLLSDFNVVILDEFHERSIHADLALALVKQAADSREDLAIVVMSATMDAEPVSRFLGGAKIVQIEARPYPIHVRYSANMTMVEAIRATSLEASGHILCFLPGAREIEDVRRVIPGALPLHGSLPVDAQERALAPSGERKIILATNVAETSLTVEGVTDVIDAGLQKVLRFDAGTALDHLVTEHISLDSAVQRSGRAGRTAPGRALRLWDERMLLRPHREAEVRRVDLASAALDIFAWGGDPRTFEWYERPPDARIEAAVELLRRLGAMDPHMAERLRAIPLHPRLARVLAGGGAAAVRVCALLSENVRGIGSGDALTLADSPRLDFAVRELARFAHGTGDVRRALLAGFPDRVAMRREPGSLRLLLSSGTGAVLARESGMHSGELLVALDVSGGGEALVRIASVVEREWLEPTHADVVHTLRDDGTVRATRRVWYDSLLLREFNVTPDPEEVTRLTPKKGLSPELLLRLTFAGLTEPEHRSSPGRLDQLAPARLDLPSGRTAALQYREDGSVLASVKLQELFGLADTPRLGPRQVPVTFALLSPAGRPVQVTGDLRSFWNSGYQQVRKELRARYPKHPWPDDPWTATPTHRAKRRT